MMAAARSNFGLRQSNDAVSDEFDDLDESAHWHLAARRVPANGVRKRALAARLVSRLYLAAAEPLRPRLLACLLKPLGPLALVGVSAGAFGRLLYASGASGARSTAEDVAHFSNEQLFELARFVEQVSPESLQEFAKLLLDEQIGMAAFSTAAAVLLFRKLSGK